MKSSTMTKRECYVHSERQIWRWRFLNVVRCSVDPCSCLLKCTDVCVTVNRRKSVDHCTASTVHGETGGWSWTSWRTSGSLLQRSLGNCVWWLLRQPWRSSRLLQSRLRVGNFIITRTRTMPEFQFWPFSAHVQEIMFVHCRPCNAGGPRPAEVQMHCLKIFFSAKQEPVL